MVKGWYKAGRRFESWSLYIYPYRGEIQFWSKFLRALENFKSCRNLEKFEFGPRIESQLRMAHRPIGPSASDMQKICFIIGVVWLDMYVFWVIIHVHWVIRDVSWFTMMWFWSSCMSFWLIL